MGGFNEHVTQHHNRKVFFQNYNIAIGIIANISQILEVPLLNRLADKAKRLPKKIIKKLIKG